MSKTKFEQQVVENGKLRAEIADLRDEVTRLEGILGGLVLPENYCGSDGREVELIVPIEVYDEACEIALKETQ